MRRRWPQYAVAVEAAIHVGEAERATLPGRRNYGSGVEALNGKRTVFGSTPIRQIGRQNQASRVTGWSTGTAPSG